jgi:hypothetical protein
MTFTPPNSTPVQAVLVTGRDRTSNPQIINLALYDADGNSITGVTAEDLTDYTTSAELTAALAPKLTATQVAAQVDSVATTAPDIVTDFNALLAKLRASGVLHA